jgi:hypothetical protein
VFELRCDQGIFGVSCWHQKEGQALQQPRL